MSTVSLMGNAFIGLMNPASLILVVVGVAVGIVFGSIPGLSAAMAVALFLPVTFAMESHAAFVLLVSLYIGGISGGLISAILLNIPGTSSERRRSVSFRSAMLRTTASPRPSPFSLEECSGDESASCSAGVNG